MLPEVTAVDPVVATRLCARDFHDRALLF